MRTCAALILAVLLSTGGCTTTRTYHAPSGEVLAGKLQRGDRIGIRTRDGRKYRAVVVELNEQEVVTRHGRYRYDDIEQLRHTEGSPGKTVLLGLSLIYLPALIASEAIEESLESR